MFFLPSIISSAVLVMLYKKMVGIGGLIVELYKLFSGSTKGIELLANSDTATLMIVIYMLWVGFGGKILAAETCFIKSFFAFAPEVDGKFAVDIFTCRKHNIESTYFGGVKFDRHHRAPGVAPALHSSNGISSALPRLKASHGVDFASGKNGDIGKNT
jgi:hypothetical protein